MRSKSEGGEGAVQVWGEIPPSATKKAKVKSVYEGQGRRKRPISEMERSAWAEDSCQPHATA